MVAYQQQVMYRRTQPNYRYATLDLRRVVSLHDGTVPGAPWLVGSGVGRPIESYGSYTFTVHGGVRGLQWCTPYTLVFGQLDLGLCLSDAYRNRR